MCFVFFSFLPWQIFRADIPVECCLSYLLPNIESERHQTHRCVMKLLMLEVKSRNTCSREAVWLQFNGLFAVQKTIYCLAVFIPLLRLELVDLSFVLGWDKQSSFSPQSYRVLKSRFKCNLNPPHSISSLVALNVIFTSCCDAKTWADRFDLVLLAVCLGC